MHCARCGIKNSKTSKFCRECGRRLDLGVPQPIAEDDIELVEETQEPDKQVGDVLFEAFQSYERGKLDEAIQLCYEAVRMDSLSTDAHSLLGMIYEKKGDEDAAIRHYQRVLVINPKSVADREKLEELQKRKNQDFIAPISFDERIRSGIKVTQEFLASKRPWPAAIGAALGTFLILALLWPSQTAQQGATQTQAPSGQYPGASAAPSQQNPPPTPPNSSGDLNFIGGGTRAAQPAPANPQAGAPVEVIRPQVSGSAPATRVAPLPGTTRITDLPPMRIEPRPAPSQPRTDSSSSAQPSREPAGVISIQRSPAPSTAAKNPVEQARSFQIGGQYEEAITAWRQALSGTKYPGEIHQQIATCYQRLGRHSDAVSSYQAAVRSYQQQIAAGYNVEEAERGIRSSELAARISQREGG